MFDFYGNDVLTHDPYDRRRQSRDIHIAQGLLIEDVQSGFVGEVMSFGRVAGKWQMELEGRGGVRRSFPLGKGYWIEGVPVNILPPVSVNAPQRRKVTASGSFHVEHRARVAKASRIWVEGKHDAELIQKVWGEDLALEGVVVEELLGVDNLPQVLADFHPSNSCRAGVLVDHLVPGSKESRIAQSVAGEGVLVLGHPYVDVWQAVKPQCVGLRAWPTVPLGEDIKVGTLKRMGWPHHTPEDIGKGWARILSKVQSYKDIEPALLGRMEELIDFVTASGTR
ncbi:DUF3097 family protein [Actinotignum urinale]|uniref:DUF3097 family protein n=1 Tax=Actinotignum urinale TaxID=190146 RepID=A0AAW9HW66_9ACTO|nr:DUF3097 family protein [Actinotignum urinale]MDY5128772.1 DUF3097 family protein [Actinotignum urinale]MDY5133367.1 DUF3097 family protein [Actinotignum urinale]MDY5154602.1 DUF3097 family protein [Actinotignum urinale]